MQTFDTVANHHIFSLLNDLAILLPVFLAVFTFRGFTQALFARLMGDRTAQRQGFLTLNPLAHVDLPGILITLVVMFGLGVLFVNQIPRTLLFIAIILLGVRWSYPVPIDDTEFKHYRLGGFLTTMAGPIGNFLCAFISFPILKLILISPIPPYMMATFIEIFRTLIDISLFFCALDLIPIPPFNAGRALRYILPKSSQGFLEWLEFYSIFIFLILILVPGISDIFFGIVHFGVLIIKQFLVRLFF